MSVYRVERQLGVGSQTSWTVKWRVLSEVNADIEFKGNGVEDVRLIALE